MAKGPWIAAIASGLVALGIGAVASARGRILPFGRSTKPREGGSTPSPAPPAPPAPSGGAAASQVRVRNSTIYGPGGASVPITDTDALWLARAITGEVRADRPREAKLAVAWALANNLMLVARRSSSTPPRYSTFRALILAYCQPVNPLWRDPNGRKCREHPRNCTARQIERRQQLAVTPWADIAPDVREIVEDFRAGRTTNPVPGLVDWHASTYEGAVRQIGGNHFGVLQGRSVLV